MWCDKCQADVAAEVDSENRRARCASCGSELSINPVPEFGGKIKAAHDILERLSDEPLSEPFGPTRSELAIKAEMENAMDADDVTADDSQALDEDDATAGRELVASEELAREAYFARSAMSAVEQTAVPIPNSIPQRQEENQPAVERVDRSRPVYRIDAPHPVEDFARHNRPFQQPDYGQAPAPQPPVAPSAAVSPQYPQSVQQPHFDVQAEIERQETGKVNWVSLFGQLLAYAGVLGLTGGTAMVLAGHFGQAAENFTTNGWLLTTAGQMLLFLGVITLVTAGMEQTTREVSRRMDALGRQMLRIEQASHNHALRGPSIPAEQFAERMPGQASSGSPVRSERFTGSGQRY